MRCVSRTSCLLSTCMSTVRRGLPFSFQVLTIPWHQVTGSLTGTASMTPSLTSLSIDDFTSCCQCRGTGIGSWTATGLVSWSTWSSNGGPSIRGSVWHSRVLRVLDRYLSSIQFRKAAGWRQLLGMLEELVMVAVWCVWSISGRMFH